jgi:hypothetical protein
MPPVPINICDNFSARPGEEVNWQNLPASCTISQDGSSAWPFNLPQPIVFPMPSQRKITVAKDMKPGKYYFVASCCPKPICVTVI